MIEVMLKLALGGAILLANNTLAQNPETPAVGNPALRTELLDRLQRDQNIRKELVAKGTQNPDQALVDRMDDIDSDNTARMTEIINRFGWPGPEMVGKDGTQAAFVLVQHGALEFQEQVLPIVREAYKAGKLPGEDFALLEDRVLVSEGRPQVYGTQVQFKGKELVPSPIEDPGNVDKRRAKLGMPPMAEYLKALKKAYFPEDK